MQPSERERGLESARAMERRGQVDAACQAYLRYGAVEEAARLLGSQRRYADAADTLLTHLAITPGTAAGLPEGQRRLALKAAIYLGRAGRSDEAVELFLALGDPGRAAEVLERSGNAVEAARLLAGGQRTPSGRWQIEGAETTAQKLEAAGQREQALQAYVREGRPAEAAALAKQLGRLEDAAHLYVEADLCYEAARCHLQLGDQRNALRYLVRVPRDDANYRAAARDAIRTADAMNALDIHLEHFLTSYIRGGPTGAEDLEAFYRLGGLYERWNYVENAEEAWRKLLAQEAGYKDTEQRLAGLEENRLRQRDRLRKSLEGDAGYWGASGSGSPGAALPGLPELPELPEPAPAPESTAAIRAQGGTRIVRSADGGPPPAPAGARAAPGEQSWPPAASSADHDARFEVGETIAGRYRIEEQIGEGGMATVFRATDLELDEPIAMKVFRPALTDDDSLARFRQEIKLSRQLQQLNVTRVYDIGIAGGRRYLTMELLVGETFEQRLERGIALADTIEVLIQACAGLQAAHDQGIIHRDIKPDNLFLTESGLVKVMDFGIAKQQAAPGFTVMGTIAGTPEYMSPEQVNNFTNVTPATDLYALGVVAFRSFTGRLPFSHEELVPLLVMQVQDPPPPPRLLNPDIPPALEAVVLKLLEKDPAQRFADCRELAEALEALRGS